MHQWYPSHRTACGVQGYQRAHLIAFFFVAFLFFFPLCLLAVGAIMGLRLLVGVMENGSTAVLFVACTIPGLRLEGLCLMGIMFPGFLFCLRFLTGPGSFVAVTMAVTGESVLDGVVKNGGRCRCR